MSALVPHVEQIRRPASRRMSSCSGTSTSTTMSGSLPQRSMISSSACAYATVRGNPSSTKPRVASGRTSRPATIAIIVSSSTSPPRSILALASRAIGFLSLIASRRMSPVEIFNRARSRANRPACVPFPAPGGPIMMTFRPIAYLCLYRAAGSSPTSSNPRLLHEAVVVAHDQLRLDLLHGVHRYADHDQQRRAAEVERDAEALRKPRRQHRVEPLADQRSEERR